jgi:hypothetical protein
MYGRTLLARIRIQCAKYGSCVIFCMTNRTKWVLLVSVMSPANTFHHHQGAHTDSQQLFTVNCYEIENGHKRWNK